MAANENGEEETMLTKLVAYEKAARKDGNLRSVGS